MSMPPGSPVPPDSHGETQPQAPYPPVGGSAPQSGRSFWDSDTNRLIAIVGAILVGCLVLGGVATTAAVAMGAIAKNRDGRVGMMSHNGGGGPQGRMGRRGQGDQGGPGSQGAPGGPGGGMRGGADTFPGVQHGDVVVTGPTGQPQTKRIARGTIAAATATSLTIKSTDGVDTVFTIDANTKITGGPQSGSVATLAVGKTAFAIGTVTGTTATAERVLVTAN